MPDSRTHGLCAGLLGLIFCANPAWAEIRQSDLDAIRTGSAGIELAGIVLATADRQGRIHALASGCARFSANSRVNDQSCAVPLRTDGLMRVASISKLVTAAKVQRSIDRGYLALDQDVSSVLGFDLRNPSFPIQAITVRQLLNHTSSIIDSEQYWLPWPETIDANSRTTHRFDTEHAPGSYFRYCNFNYVLLGQILERLSGQPFGVLMSRHQFEPLKLTAGFNWHFARAIDPARVVTLYRKQTDIGAWSPDGAWIAQVDDFSGSAPSNTLDVSRYLIGSNGSVFSPHGGLRIALPDLARWFAQLDRRTFKALRSDVFRVSPDGGNGASERGFYREIGHGMHAFDLPGVGKVWGHFGEAYGLRAALLRDPASHRVWAYAITGYADDPEKFPGRLPGLDTAQTALLDLLGLAGSGKL